MSQSIDLIPAEGLLPHQLEVIQDPHRFKVLIWHRKARKTTTTFLEMIKQSQIRVGAYWYMFPRYNDAKSTIWMDPFMSQLIPDGIIKKKNEQDLVFYMKNGSYIQLKGADDPDALRGPNPVGVAFDEFATMKPNAWYFIEPVLRINNGWAWFPTTPKGRNHAFEFFQRGQVPSPEWKSWILKASTSGIVDPNQLKESKAGMSEGLFNQEYECEFLQGEGSVFRGVTQIVYDDEGQPLIHPKRPEDGKRYVIGADLAKLHDFTVLTVYDTSTNEQVYQDRFQSLEWPFQKKKIAELSDFYNGARVILDATGLGDPIADDLLRANVPVEPFKITETTKKELIEKLSIWIEQRKIKMLPIEETLKEFTDFTYKLGESGKVHYGAPSGEGFFDDIVLSHALAVYALTPVYAERVLQPKSLIGRYYDRLKDDFDNPSGGPEINDEWGEEF